MTKHEVMTEYFKPIVGELANTVLNFNYSPDSLDGFGFLTDYSDKVMKRYIRAGSEKAYGFTILITKAYSVSSDDLNLEAMNFSQGLMEWIDTQNREKKYPDFGGRCQVRKLENLQNMPNLAEIDPESGVARYMIQCRVIYFEREENR